MWRYDKLWYARYMHRYHFDSRLWNSQWKKANEWKITHQIIKSLTIFCCHFKDHGCHRHPHISLCRTEPSDDANQRRDRPLQHEDSVPGHRLSDLHMQNESTWNMWFKKASSSFLQKHALEKCQQTWRTGTLLRFEYDMHIEMIGIYSIANLLEAIQKCDFRRTVLILAKGCGDTIQCCHGHVWEFSRCNSNQI